MGESNEAITRFGQRRPLPTRDGRSRAPGTLGRPGPRSDGPRLPAPSPRRPARPIDLDHMVAGYILSGLLHAAVFLVVILGLPNLLTKKPPEETAVAVQLINVAEFTRATQRNSHPVEKAKVDTPPPPEPVAKPEPPKEDVPPPPSPPPPAQQIAQAPPEPEAKPEPPKPAPPPPPPPPPAPTPEPKPPPPKPEPPKPEPPKPVAKPEPPKPQAKPADTAFDALLKNLTKTPAVSEKTDAPPRPQKPSAAAQLASAQPDAPLGSKLTTSEMDRIATAVERCWYDDPGARGNGQMSVVIRVWIDPDGTVQRTQIVDQSQMSDPVWRAFAERAERAPLNPECSKLPIPPEKYEQMKVFTFTFTPKGVS
jgi:outer membrane biosynthesis protein TonB